MRHAALLLSTLLLFAACSAHRPPRIAPALSYAAAPAPPDEPFRASPPAAGPADTTPVFELETMKLANGMQVVLVERHGLPIASVRLVVTRGARDLAGRRPELLALAAQTLGHAHDRGWGTSCAADGCILSTRARSRSIEREIADLAEGAMKPKLEQAQVEWFRRKWIDRWDITDAADANIGALLFAPNDVYAPIGADAKRAIVSTTLADLRELHEQLFHPEHTTLVVAGDVTMARLGSAVERSFGAWKPSRPAVPRSAAPAPPATAGGHAALVNYRGVLVHAYLVARTPAAGDPDAEAMSLLAGMLNTRKGVLHQEVRAEMGAAYSFSAQIATGRAASWLTVGGALDLEKALPALQAVAKAVRSARDGGVDQAELAGARTKLIASFRESAGTTTGVTSMIASALVAGMPLSDLVARQERLSRVTAADVQRVARAWLSEDRLRLVVVGPEKYIERGFENIGIGPIEWRGWDGQVLK